MLCSMAILYRDFSFVYFGIHSVPDTNPHGYQGTTNLGGRHSYTWIFDGAGLGAPHPQVFQGANVFYNVVLTTADCCQYIIRLVISFIS